MESNREDVWVTERLAALAPEWQANVAEGRKLLDARLAKPRRSWAWIPVAAAAALCIAAFAVPYTRALAQELLSRLVLHRVDVVRLDLSDLPVRLQVTANGMTQRAADLDDAAAKAGFRPDLPQEGTVNGAPALSVTGSISVQQTIHVADIMSALSKHSASDVQVPAEWEGVRLHAVIGPMVAADYPGEVQLLQAPPVEVSLPAGFALERFAEVAFRSLGVSLWEARALARKFVANPGWFLDIPPDEPVNIQELSLRNGPALLIEDFGDDGKLQRVTVIRNTSQRIYAAMSPSRQLSVRIAEALP